MKMIRISITNPYEIRIGYNAQPLYIQTTNFASVQTLGIQQQLAMQNSQQNSGAQNQLGSLAYYQGTPPSYQTTTMPNQLPVTTISIPIDSINHIEHSNNNSYASIVHLKHKSEPLYAKETAEQIEKLIHNTKFNSKMDEILG